MYLNSTYVRLIIKGILHIWFRHLKKNSLKSLKNIQYLGQVLLICLTWNKNICRGVYACLFPKLLQIGEWSCLWELYDISLHDTTYLIMNAYLRINLNVQVSRWYYWIELWLEDTFKILISKHITFYIANVLCIIFLETKYCFHFPDMSSFIIS